MENLKSEKESPILVAVEKHYGRIAREFLPKAGASCCCQPSPDGASCCSSAALYDGELLKGLPVDVTGLSLGCGDPVTIAGLKPGERVLDLAAVVGSTVFSRPGRWDRKGLSSA